MAHVEGPDWDRIDEGLAVARETADMRKEIERWRAWAKRATKALCEVRPLGGSELFMQVNGECVADPEWCGAAIIDMRDSLHRERIENVKLLRQVQTINPLAR